MMEGRIVSGRVSVGKTGFYLDAETDGGYYVSLHMVNIPEMTAIGISNITEDQQFVLFMDFDRIKKEQLDDQLDYISKTWSIDHFLVLTTGPNRYHVISFDKFELSKLREIMLNTLCDYSYRSMPIKMDKGWILRMAPKLDLDGKVVRPKPDFVEFHTYGIRDEHGMSRAHVEMFGKMFPEISTRIPELGYYDSRMDGNETVNVIKYGTSQKDFTLSAGLDKLVDSKRLNISWVDEDE